MSQRKHTWSETRGGICPGAGGPPRGSNAPWMAPAGPQVPSFYYVPGPGFTRRTPWSSDIARSEMTKEQIKLERDCVVQRTIVSTRPRSTCAKFWMSLKESFPCSKAQRARRLDALTLPFIPYDRRKAYGHHAHPTVVNRVQVRSSTLRYSSSATIEGDDLRRSLHSTHNVRHHDAGSNSFPKGTSLPPRTYDQSRIRFPPPLSHNVRLNPHLQHHCNGPHPIVFDIARGPNKIMYNTHASSNSTAPLDPAYLTQPATSPPVTRMHIQGVAEDPLPHFPWPIEVKNARGITCGDVLDAIVQKLLEYVSEKEYNTWTKYRKAAAGRAYHQRARIVTPVNPSSLEKTPDVDARDGLRRIDYMGEKVIVVFHGLEQVSPTMNDMWFLYLGASERSKA